MTPALPDFTTYDARSFTLTQAFALAVAPIVITLLSLQGYRLAARRFGLAREGR